MSDNIEQLRADVKRLILERNRMVELVAKWRDMPAEEMRLRAGDMTAQEIRSIKAVLNAILPNTQREGRADNATSPEPLTPEAP